jgi:hypothetical protein
MAFTLNPTNLEETAERILEFVLKCEQNPNYWNEISQQAINEFIAPTLENSHYQAVIISTDLWLLEL